MAGDTPRKYGQLRTWMERIGTFGPAVLLTIAAFAVAYHFVQPAPPRHIVMATGVKDGVYYYYGAIYRDLMAQQGITVTLDETAGSIANIDLLNRGDADVAFVQGGTRSDDGHSPLRSLASLYFEPIWIFVRKDLPVTRLADLRGRRVAVAGEGSGTRVIALQLLADTGLDDTTVQISSLGGTDAATALRDGGLDAAFFINSANAPLVRDLFAAPDIRLLPIDRAPAYRLQHRFLSLLTLPEGAIDLATDVPVVDTVLLAPAANLVVREDFHPALADLLLNEARKIHGYPGIFEEAGEFPSRNYLEYPIADAAQRFFDSGPSLLQRYLPFWAANFIDRLKIMLLPLIALAYPFLRVIPPTYNWRMRSRIDRWYKELQSIEHNLEISASREELGRRLTEIEALEQKVRRLTMPVAYGNPLYSLRLHIAMLRDELRSAVEHGTEPGRS
ncbi:MAG TPA: TAXI family TRAP transporter solute-binding subunit [Stellaceae bacterium]|nr:TAXI family TRAP transporter solute-binding subunit [Stellaceae bacterium]